MKFHRLTVQKSKTLRERSIQNVFHWTFHDPSIHPSIDPSIESSKVTELIAFLPRANITFHWPITLLPPEWFNWNEERNTDPQQLNSSDDDDHRS